MGGPTGYTPSSRRRVEAISNDIDIGEAVAALNAEVFYVSAAVNRQAANKLREIHDRRSRSGEDCILVLTTFGGDPDAAYLMARFLSDGHPNGFRAFIIGRCKSAGTLLALGAREIIMGCQGELGPLDIQVSEKDEPFRLGSGLELFTTLNSLAQNTFATFETYMLQLIGRSASQISMRTAAKIATELTVGIMSPIAEQIDPLQFGRQERALNIVKAYAERLGVPDRVVGKLATDYPDHGFVIDLREAEKLLGKKVRAPNENEAKLERALASLEGLGLYDPQPQPIVVCLNDIPGQQQNDTRRENTDEGQEPDLRGDQEGEQPEVDGKRSRDGSDLHQADLTR